MIDTINETRLIQLKELLKVLAEAIDDKPGARDLSQLCKQYRETIAEIERIEGEVTQDDDIAAILSVRADHGKAGAVRKDRT